MTSPAIDTGSSDASTGPTRDVRLIEARLRQAVGEALHIADVTVPRIDYEQLMEGDAGHLHRAYSLRDLPVESQRRLSGPVVTVARRALLRLLHPLPEVQTTLNAANARVTTLLLRQVVAQSRRIELLEQRVMDLDEKLDQ